MKVKGSQGIARRVWLKAEAQGTIEEKIVELHRHKRDLADSLLEGTDSSGKLSTDELLRLIRED